ncbi:hypothetical protein K402DRAFT_421967 [Aulographum hederae CBS 113979]|uniref:RRM domain-containing protein n=1 Tax=Aulographum hederae CBS 113979 TaxID=1176131 RepID=A0A6G1GXK9_9PEZI|nr:hypothetical protein K402DRAFT_421967 [Aulographum hederae CBS 113979]
MVAPKKARQDALASKLPIQVSGYTVLPLTLPPLSSFPKKTTHYLYLRPHAPKVPDEETPKSLFLVNFPIDATEDNLRKLFSREVLGGSRVKSVIFEDLRDAGNARKKLMNELRELEEESLGPKKGQGKKRKRRGQPEEEDSARQQDGSEGLNLGDTEGELPTVWDREILRSGSSAVVVFVDKISADAALKAARRIAKKGEEVIWRGEGEALGLRRYQNHHELSHPPKHTLQSSVNSYLAAFSRVESLRTQIAKRNFGVPDEDGFVTVSKGGRSGVASMARAEKTKERHEERTEKRVGDGFYRFQLREERKKREGELVRKFEEDRERVEKMRKSGKRRKVEM